MGILVTTIRADVKRKFNGISDEDFLSLLNKGHAKICGRVQLYPEETAIFAWTAQDVTDGRREWPIPSNVRRGWQARYWASSSSSSELERINKHKLDAMFPEWRVEDAGTPSYWYEDGGMLGLYPKPDTAPTSGYPKVELYSANFRPLDLDDELPGLVVDSAAWEFFIKWRYAEDRGEGQAERFRLLHRAALKELADDISSINARDHREAHVYTPAVVNL